MFEAARAALQALLEQPIDEADARHALGELAGVRSLVEALEVKLTAVIARRGDASAAVRGATRCSQREADRRAARSQTITELPALGASLAQGRTTAEHVDVLARAVDATSAAAVAASDLLARAEQRPPDLLARDVRSFIRTLETDDGAEERQRRQQAMRSCSLFRGDNGMWVLHAELDEINGVAVRTALDRAATSLFHTDGGRGVAADRRTPTQRRADALVAMLTPTGGACRDTVATASPPSVRNQMIIVVTDDGSWVAGSETRLAPSEVERLARGSDLYGLVLSAEGDPLWLGRRRRMASDGQWRALIVRDGGCVICGARPARCEAHHVEHWQRQQNGPTDIDNLALLCSHHHHQLHDKGLRLYRTSDGWQLRAPP
ncbi:MAG: DUF222 domain-containing protein [Actinomycetota bacterium]